VAEDGSGKLQWSRSFAPKNTGYVSFWPTFDLSHSRCDRCFGAPISDLVFCDRLGQPLVGRRVERVFKQLLVKAGLPTSFTPHSLSTATFLLSGGVPDRVVMQILGHSSISMTAHYEHILESMMEEAGERPASVFPSVVNG
jgi:site-specific recombinase XerD